MFGNWFGKRPSRPSEREVSFRPELEYLEGRLAPSGIGNGQGDGNGNGNGHGNDNGNGPPGHVNQHINQHINVHDSFNNSINDSFNTAVNNIAVNQFFSVVNNNTTIVQQNFFTNAMLAAQQNFSALIGLVETEALLAGETLAALTSSASGVNNLGLLDQIHALQFNIQTNPLEATPVGETAGFLAFDLALEGDVGHH